MKLLFVKGDKGLVANYKGKFYFPNRGSNITEEGLYECNIKVDKDKYAFVDGEEIKTTRPSSEQLTEIFRNKLDRNAEITLNDFKIRKIGKSFICYDRNIDNDQFVTLCYYDENDKRYDLLPIAPCWHAERSIMAPTGDHLITKAVTNMYRWEKYEDDISDADIMNIVIENLSSDIKSEDFNKVIAYILCDRYYDIKNGGWSYVTINKIDVFYNRYFVFNMTYNSGYGNSKNYNVIYSILDDNGIFKFRTNTGSSEFADSDVAEYGDPCYTISFKDIIDYMYENRIGRHTMYNYDEEWCKNLIVHEIPIMNSSVEVLYLDGSKLLKTEYTDEEIKKANASFERISATKKRIGKNVTKSNIDELKKLTPQSIIGF